MAFGTWKDHSYHTEHLMELPGMIKFPLHFTGSFCIIMCPAFRIKRRIFSVRMHIFIQNTQLWSWEWHLGSAHRKPAKTSECRCFSLCWEGNTAINNPKTYQQILWAARTPWTELSPRLGAKTSQERTGIGFLSLKNYSGTRLLEAPCEF